jgi:hypothetical protein
MAITDRKWLQAKIKGVLAACGIAGLRSEHHVDESSSAVGADDDESGFVG